MAETFPVSPSTERQKSMESLLSNLCVNLPCPGCSVHCSEYVIKHPPRTSSRDDLKKWAVDFHNAVNKRTGKRELSYKEAEDKLREKFFNIEEWKDIQRAEAIRIEDHKDIKRLQKNGVPEEEEENNKTVLIVGGITIGVLLLLVFFLAIKKRK